MNFLFCSVGRRAELIKVFKSSLDKGSKIIATDCVNTAPALYFADKQYIVPKITDNNYLEKVLEICKRENINVITTFIDPEIEILSKNRESFEAIGVEVLVPYLETAEICFDKFEMYKYLIKNNIKTVVTYEDFNSFHNEYKNGTCKLPVFVKPRTGSGSVGARKINSVEDLKSIFNNESNLIIQEFMDGDDIDADVYVDTVTHKPVSIFTKRKLETKIGGANKTISFKDNELVNIIRNAIPHFKFNGPIDIDFFYKDGEYYLSEINPRFGGAYLHAYGCGVDFIKLIINNLNGIENEPEFGNYDEDVLMMMYDSVVIRRKDELSN
ncbi:ATP-grasp domain-containing protein [Sporosarcina sp. BP05]|uniref:ATP-grasp domain-containing protein n=1 Tax=Sporosarcina sp. BP05 TaxID=2758726 RepID=UPI0016451714|nr:ATP-grasp domain-containing protein [Sporosarcina sp. BP05]